MKIKLRLKWVIAIVAVCLAAVSAYAYSSQGVDAETVEVKKGSVARYVEDTAEVKSHESSGVYIEGSGRITEVFVDTGDKVKQGDLLLKMDSTDLELQLKNAEAGVEAAKAQLKGTDLINYANKIEVAKAAADQARVAYEASLRSYENAKRLYDTGAMSKDEFERAGDAFKTAAANLDYAEAQLKDIKAGAPVSVRDAYAAQLEQAIILRDTIMKSLEKQEVRAPIAGVILERHVEKNSIGVSGAPAFSIGDTAKLELSADILAEDSVNIQVGSDVEVSGKALGEARLQGRVVKIAPAAKMVTSSLGVNQKRVPVTIELQGDNDLLKPGYNVDVKIITDSRNDVITVPDSAVFEYKDGDYVFVLDAKGRAVLRQVKKGMEGDSLIEISEGLKEGDIVLSKPDNDIEEGMKIKPSGE